MSVDEEIEPFKLLDVSYEATEQEIKSAYRKSSLKVHPDRNPNNPNAAQKFHELNQAYELLLDPLRRLALTSSIRAKEARKARFSKHDQKRKKLQDELEEREKAFKKRKTDEGKERRERERENERIKEEGRKMREERAEIIRQADEEGKAAAADDEVPPLGTLDTTIKLKYTLYAHSNLTTPASLTSLLSQFGAIDEASIVISLKPPKKAPTTPPKSGIALVPFRQIGDAFAAVCASGRNERGLDGVEVSWAEGKEPLIIGWLKRKGKLGTPVGKDNATKEEIEGKVGKDDVVKTDDVSANLLNEKAANSSGMLPFASFPESFSSSSDSLPPQTSASAAAGLDYESLTLMRLRQAERERLEREIVEREAGEGH